MIDVAATSLLLPTASAAGRSVTDRHLAILDQVAEAGLQIVLALEAQAKGGAVVVEGDIAMAFNRVARAVRHTLMLRAKLAGQMHDDNEAAAQRKAGLRQAAARLLRGAIEAEADSERAENLTAGAAERLRGEDFGDLLSRPFDEAVAGICRDLGLAPDQLRLIEDACEAASALGCDPRTGLDADGGGPFEVQWMAGPKIGEQRPQAPP